MKLRVVSTALILAFAVLALRTDEIRDFALTNLGVQIAIFVPIAHLQGWRRNQISFVDIAWPTGLVAIGVQLLFFAERITPVVGLCAAFYVLMGARMSIWATRLHLAGETEEELPRYRYQRLRWEREGFRSERLSVMFEISAQMAANFAMLAMPAYVIATNATGGLSAIEIAFLAVAVAGYGFESLADLQKSRFIGGYSGTGTDICDVGLWRYSRHPNYFGQWVQWVGLAGLAIPSLVDLQERTGTIAWLGLLIYLMLAAAAMYYTLVHHTGAVPAEHYSVRKRPAYAAYQATVNRFFPGPRRDRRNTAPQGRAPADDPVKVTGA